MDDQELQRLLAAVRAVGVEFHVGAAPEDDDLRSLCELWRDKTVDGRLPSRQALDPRELGFILPHIVMVDVQHQPRRFRWRLIGTAITTIIGRDSTGKWFDEVFEGDRLTGYSAGMEIVLRLREPVRATAETSATGQSQMGFESVLLPLAQDGETIDIILMATKYR